MPNFSYKALGRDGKEVRGVLQAESEAAAASRIRENYPILLSISQKKEKKRPDEGSLLEMEIGSRRIKTKKLAILCSQFALTLHSGMTVAHAMRMLADQNEDKRIRKIMGAAAEEVAAGSTVASALEKYSDRFPLTFIETIRAGEQSGTLERSFDRLQKFYEKSYKTTEKIKGAMTYPLFVVAVAVVVLIIVMAKVIPTLADVFADLGGTLPLMTEEQLRLNLPYEFHDYIGNEMDKYVFDYAMIYADQEKMDLIGAACTKELSQQFEKLAKMAHLKLVGLVPAVLGLEWILEYAEERMADEKKALETKLNAEPHKKEEKENAEGAEKSETVKDYAILDLGTQALRIHFFRHGIYDITRTMEPGCEEIEQIRLGDKNKMQELGIEVEEENREETDKEKMAAVLEEQYRTRAVQVMRVLNFYSFNNVNNTIDSLYYCGGGARYGELIDALKETLDLPVRSVAELLPEVSLDEEDEWIDSPQAYGVLLA